MIQQALAEPIISSTDSEGKQWTVKVRIGVHTAVEELHPNASGDYGGADVNFAARVESLGAGGQLLVSETCYQAAGSRGRRTPAVAAHRGNCNRVGSNGHRHEWRRHIFELPVRLCRANS